MSRLMARPRFVHIVGWGPRVGKSASYQDLLLLWPDDLLCHPPDHRSVLGPIGDGGVPYARSFNSLAD